MNGLLFEGIEFGVVERFGCDLRVSPLMGLRVFEVSVLGLVMNFGKGESDGLFLFEDGGEVETTELSD
jgi:hypothetical protein